MPSRNREQRLDQDASIPRSTEPIGGLQPEIDDVDTENAMSNRKFEFGDRVRHADRPEWGVGSVVRAEPLSSNGVIGQRLAVRFPNQGIKTISTGHATLELVTEEATVGGPDAAAADPLAGWGKMKDSEWLGEVAQRKVREAMVAISESIRDPFTSVEERLKACLGLFRFERTGGSLIDWAVAQSGLDDPLSRFTRHELELLFDQWASNRQEHLQQVLAQAHGDQQMVARLLAGAPSAARESVRRLTADR